MFNNLAKRFKSDSNVFYQLVREIRPRQWFKNMFVYGALVFGGELFDLEFFFKVTLAFFVFCFLASFVYIVNDISDVEKDKLHPIKKNRPIASGKLSVGFAIKAAILFLTAGMFLSAFVNDYLFYLALAYLVLQLFYTYFLKNIIIIDALTISLGFIFRVFAGGVAVSLSISSWLILSVIGLSLLIAFGKRRGERTVLSSKNLDLKTRETLRHYPDSLLDAMISMAASFTIITYALFTFQTSPSTSTPSIFAALLPNTLSAPKWMMLTIPIVIYGVARYLYVIYESKQAESPERALFSDKPFLTSIIIWGISIVFFYYVLGTVNL